MPFNLRSHYLYTATSAQPPARPVCSNYGSRLGGRTQRRYLSPTSSPAIGFLFISSLFGVCAPWCGEVKIGFAKGAGRARARAPARAGSGVPAGAGGNETRGGVCGWRGGPAPGGAQPRARDVCARAVRVDRPGSPGGGGAGLRTRIDSNLEMRSDCGLDGSERPTGPAGGE